jgi:23S rRNA (cytosine1962-C5)-methyltransferase
LSDLPLVTVSGRGAARLEAGHLWVYASDVTDPGKALPGAVVRVIAPRGRTLGVAHYSATSQIALRLLSREVEPVDATFCLRRLRAAVEHRSRVVRESSAYRLVHAEGDLLPGLIADRYGDYIVLQLLSQGMDRARDWIVEALIETIAPAGILARNDAAVRRLEGLPQETEVLHGTVPERVEVQMNGLTLLADLRTGQKTGFYLDQRENYLAAARWARGRALDCFTSTGGFALHMAVNCESVEAVDSSAKALAAAQANRDRNAITNISFREADVFQLLSGYVHAGRAFDLVVLDPPAFAKTRNALDQALRGYCEINYRALSLLKPGGVLVTCSCSYHVSEADLLGTVAQAALDARRTLRVLERRTQAQDHPILLTVPESCYLKCLVLEVI